MKNYFLLFFIIFVTIGFGQQKKSELQNLLWNSVQKCYKNFEDVNDDGTVDYDKIDDTKNGYLKIEGSWPTCGCSCTAIAGAYKDTHGKYTILQKHIANCGWEQEITSNRPLSEILPYEFGINYFTGKNRVFKNFLGFNAFYIDFEIPRKGTETWAKLKLIPLGLFPLKRPVTTYEYSQKTSTHKQLASGIQTIARNLVDDTTLTHLLRNKIDQIHLKDKKLIDEQIGDDDSRFKSIQELRQILMRIMTIHEVYNKLETTELLLDWNREKAQFYVKKKGKPHQKVSFKNFLINTTYWSYAC